MASANDLLMKVGTPGTATTLSANYTTGSTSITVASTANWPSDTGVIFAMDEVETVNGEEVRVAGSYREFEGTVDTATTITNVDCVFGTDRDFSAGASTRVYIPVSAERENRLVTWGEVDHEQTGSHKTLTDTNGNEWLERGVTASAVNHVKVTNAATGNAPTIEATGSDTNVGLILDTKGSGELDVRAPWTGWITNTLPSVSSVTNNGNRSYDITFASTVASLLSPGMRLKTTRTVTAPTQCADLEASSSQYFNDTTVSGITFTDDFACGAWVKLESYPAATICTIISRSDNNNGWVLAVNSDGTVKLEGRNAGSANYSRVTSYQSLPLGKWVHVSAQLDMSAFTATTTTSYIMFDGVNVPSVVARAGTNPTALVQAGSLEVGGFNGGLIPFDGKLAQVWVSSAKVTQANVQALMSQGLTTADTATYSLASAYSLSDSLTDLNTTSANNLTAQNSAAATNADSPFGQDSNGVTAGTTDYALVMKVSTTTATVQVPGGCTIPTSGGVTSVAYSTTTSPFGFTLDKGRWEVLNITKTQISTGSVASSATVTNFPTVYITVPVGSGYLDFNVWGQITAGSTTNLLQYIGLSTANSSFSDLELLTRSSSTNVAVTEIDGIFTKGKNISVSSATPYYLNSQSNTNTTIQYITGTPSTSGANIIRFIPAGI